jgi:putative oxidoreductase
MLELFRNDAVGKLVLRLLVGVLILFHGVSKLTSSGSLDFITTQLTGSGLPGFIAYGVFVGEVIAPLLLILGIYSRVGGALVACNMLFAVGLMHTGDLFAMTEHGGYRLELQAFYLFGGLAVLFLGSGRYAVKPD